MIDSLLPPLNSLSPAERRESYESRARARLLVCRRTLGFTQIRMAQEVGCSRTAIEDYERGESRVPAWVLEAAAELKRRIGQ